VPESPKPAESAPPPPANPAGAEQEKLSDQLERWLNSEGDKTLGSLIALFEEKSFAILFVLLLGVSALPLPTGGATHVFQLAGEKRQRFINALLKMIRRLERLSRPRLQFLFDHRLTNIVFGLLVIAGSAGAFFAPPFSGLDTLPSLGVVLLSLGVLLEDFVVVVLAVVVGVAGVVLEVVLGKAAISGIGKLF
jgi:hypothetical protein